MLNNLEEPAQTVGYRRDAANVSDQSKVKSDFPEFSFSQDGMTAKDRLTESMNPDAMSSATLSTGLDGPLVTTCASLALVLGLFALVVFLWRRMGGPRGGGILPTEAVRTIGHTMIDAKTRLTLIKVGRRVVLASQSHTGIQTLCEIEDRDEVTELLAMCDPKTRQTFHQTMRQIEREPARGGFSGGPQRKSRSDKASTWSASV
ncbi:MAG: flagellar biosynthetic protein FliO [Planctomycetota bacterium]